MDPATKTIAVASCSPNLNSQHVARAPSPCPALPPSSSNSPPSKMNLDPTCSEYAQPSNISKTFDGADIVSDLSTTYSPPVYTVWNSPDGTQHITVGLTYDPLDIVSETRKIKSPRSGAIVLFVGTTRDNFEGKPVSHLSYSAYPALALNTLLGIAKIELEKHDLVAACIVHRLGTVPIGEESVIVGVSSPHRIAAFRSGEEILERVKERAEIWKKEVFSSGEEVWRENKDSMG